MQKRGINKILVTLILFILLYALIVNAQNNENLLNKGNKKLDKGEITIKENNGGIVIRREYEPKSNYPKGKSEVIIPKEIAQYLRGVYYEKKGDNEFLKIELDKLKLASEEGGKYIAGSDIGSVNIINIPLKKDNKVSFIPLKNRMRIKFETSKETPLQVISGGKSVKVDKGELISKKTEFSESEIKNLLNNLKKINKDYLEIKSDQIFKGLKKAKKAGINIHADSIELIIGGEMSVLSFNTDPFSNTMEKKLEYLYGQGLRGSLALSIAGDEKDTRIAVIDTSNKDDKIETAKIRTTNPEIEKAQNAMPIILSNTGLTTIDFRDPTSYAIPHQLSHIGEIPKMLDPTQPLKLEDLIKSKEEEIKAAEISLEFTKKNFGHFDAMSVAKRKELAKLKTELKELAKLRGLKGLKAKLKEFNKRDK